MDEPGPRPPTSPDAAPGRATSSRRDIAPLLVGYWGFGQFWGVWVILVSDFQAFHGITDSRMGLYYTLLSVTAVVRDGLPRAAAAAVRRCRPACRSVCS